MEKIRISSKNKFINDVIALYETAFPQNERRETGELIRLIDNCPEFHFNVFADGEQFIGFSALGNGPISAMASTLPSARRTEEAASERKS